MEAMGTPIKPQAAFVLVPMAVFTTLTAMAMASVAAWDRGGNTIDRALFVALSVALIAAVHLMPAFSRRPFTWALWFGCLLCAIYGHLTFFVHAALRAGDNQAQHSVQVVGTGQQIQAAREALAGITARPVAVVAAELAITHGRRQRSALRLELSEARNAESLRAELVNLAGTVTTAQVAASSDPVISRLAEVTGSSDASISLAVGVIFAVMLELVGVVLWCEALRPQGDAKTPAIDPVVVDPVADLRRVIEAGRCKPTVAGIRSFLGCSQTKAVEMRRALLAGQ